ncbi:MAG: hypothetical protein NT123_26875, partial [Proteobacteria bacterium]|nr:hypothetical protein [Pseudomonadota bacterium]
LSNLESSHSKLLQIVLFGQPELDAHLSMPHMRQLKERITHSFRLEPMLRSDIEAYLDFRMRAAGYRGPNVFNPKAVRRIVKASEGLTRRVNILADKSLLAAFADNEHGITAKHVDRAVRDSEFYRPAFSKAKIGLAAGGVAAGLALGLGLHYLLAPPIQFAPTPFAPAAQIVAITAAPVPLAAPATDAANPPAQPPGVQANSAAPIPPAPPATASAPSPATPSAQQADAAPAAAKAVAAPATKTQPEPIAAAATAKAAPAPGLAAAAASSAEPEPATGAKPGSKNYVPPAPPAGKLTRERFSATQEWLKTAPGGQYSVQILTSNVKDLHRIEDVLSRAPGKDLKLSDFYVYGVKINDQQHYRLAYGLYPDLVEVSQGVKSMPAAYRQFGLFYRSVERMRSQNRQ